MADDIVERLWEWQDHKDGGDKSYALYLTLGDAADEIERLRNELEIVTVHMTHVNETNLHIIDGLQEQLEEFRRG